MFYEVKEILLFLNYKGVMHNLKPYQIIFLHFKYFLFELVNKENNSKRFSNTDPFLDFSGRDRFLIVYYIYKHRRVGLVNI